MLENVIDSELKKVDLRLDREREKNAKVIRYIADIASEYGHKLSDVKDNVDINDPQALYDSSKEMVMQLNSFFGLGCPLTVEGKSGRVPINDDFALGKLGWTTMYRDTYAMLLTQDGAKILEGYLEAKGEKRDLSYLTPEVYGRNDPRNVQ